MPTADPPIAHIAIAERAGSGGPSQDRGFTTPNAVIVLDGASQPDATDRNGGWVAQHLGSTLAARLTAFPRADLADALHDAIDSLARGYGLVPSRSPSTTVAIARWDAAALDVLVLGDTPVIVQTRHGRAHPVRDDRLAQVGDRSAYHAAIATGGFTACHPDEWRSLIAAQRAARNRAGGYWIAEAVPDAARHAVLGRWPIAEVAAVLVLTDGVADGVDVYGVPPDWPAALAIAARDPAELVDLVHQAEEGDPDGVRWPRSKHHDDKTAVHVRFSALGAGSS